MIINKAALARRPAVMVLVVFMIVAGLTSYLSLPRESSPDITIPYVFVTTAYEGVAPEDMETLVTMPLERKLKGLSDVEEITSVSDDGISAIAIEFTPDVDIDDALQKVRDKVDQAKPDLPADLPDDPIIEEKNFSDFPILNVVISGPFSLKRLKVFAEDFEDRMEGVEGVLDVELVGGLEREIHVEVDLDRVAFYNMPFQELLNAVQDANVNMPGGSMDIGRQKYLVRVPEEYENPNEINSIVAFVRDGKPVYLRDIATIRDHYKDPSTISRINGQQSVTLQVKKRTGANIVEVIDAVKVVLDEIRPQFPPDLRVDLTGDKSTDIRNMVRDLENNILTGLILVLAVVLVFIGGRSALFVSVAIPLSMLITFILLQAFGITLNMVVLFSLTLALGMLVDNGIVIVENIYRHMQQGKSREEAAAIGTDQVAWPVITSTLTTVGAFFPMIFWPGIMGEFMSFLPKTVIISLFASLLVALVVNPVFSALWQTAKTKEQEARPGLVDRVVNRIRDRYSKVLAWALDNRFKVMAASLLLFVGSIMAFGMFGRGVEFFPETDPKVVYVNIKSPIGTNLDASDELTRKVEQVALEYPNIRFVIANVGTEAGGGLSSSGGGNSHLSSVALDFKDFHDRSRPSPEVADEIRDRLTAMIKGAEIRVEQEQEGPPTGKPINLEISGDDMDELGRIAEEVRKRIRDLPGLIDLKDDFVSSKPEIRVDVDKEKAALLGISAYNLAYTVKAAVNGAKVGTYREGKDEYDIVAKLPEKDRTSVEGVKRITVSGPEGRPIPLTSLATVRISSGLGTINRIDQKRVVTVSADIATGYLANDLLKEIKEILADYPLPRGYEFTFTGEQEEQAKAQAFLGKAFVACLFIIFLVLVSQFNSVLTPFIILTSVMLSLIGVFLGLLACNMPFGVIMTGVGVISLAGVVVNNAIVLIDYFEQLMARGMGVREALLHAGKTRFRPVILTAITTVLGLLPMATGVSFDFFSMEAVVGGESSQWWGSMAVAVIFGLGVATVLTLVVVPVLCSLKVSLSDWLAGRRSKKHSAES
ncbi:Multidrug efflux pump subunit AcrB [Paucidesulfovibrio gracilis DSM 16080]|uniref:Multidrug efflux pump subunit AcrB n=1 Tax=Paucidesulfovibrio gracilis DSM 16080 TaxID=1121449 RepID=A0A1T4W4W5_9BACT|nr:efflux RND transporter permease subunit [Paucidesulfovibrio gracilis]SKA72273.1 Multidrug efflux pump subunit AcrB [Paucidesulfovibrio gracilis DSM 16080]